MSVDQFGSGDSGRPFYQVWIDAVSKPNVENFRQIVGDPKASLGTALLWLAGAGFFSSLISGVLQSVFNVTTFYSDYLGYDVNVNTSFIGVIGGAFASIFITPLVALIGVGIIQLVARALGGTGDFDKLFYGFATFWVPISLVNAVIGGIPVINCLTFPIAIYALVLMVLANQAVHEYEVGKAILSSVGVPLVILVVLFACLVLLVVLGVASFLPFLENFANQYGMLLPLF
jgi:hypothetical protein